MPSASILGCCAKLTGYLQEGGPSRASGRPPAGSVIMGTRGGAGPPRPMLVPRKYVSFLISASENRQYLSTNHCPLLFF